ncbi:MAG: universal stress protein [Gammaproteobacteria bacterium]|nr:universal stress protein [Gammaproteobacteria bacterium]
MAEFDEIVVPVDGSDGAGRAATFAARLAAAVNCPIRLIYVFPATGMAMVGFSTMSAEEIKRAQSSAAKDIFGKARAAIGDAVGEVDEIVLLGDPANELIGYVDQHPKTLVVMGRRGLSPMKSLLMGSVSEKLARHAQGAVTLVN